MANTTPKMGLRLWDQLVDPYNHQQLADNWSKVDFHDHTPGRGVQIPTEGLANSSVSPTKLDPQVFSMYRTVVPEALAAVPAGQAAGTYVISRTTGTLILPGTNAASLDKGVVFYFDPADYTVTGRTTKFRLRAYVHTNATAPGINFTVGLYPINTWVGTNGVLPAVTFSGAAVASTTFTTPGTGVHLLQAATEVTLANSAPPATGFYSFGVVLSGAMPVTNPYAIVGADLTVRQV